MNPTTPTPAAIAFAEEVTRKFDEASRLLKGPRLLFHEIIEETARDFDRHAASAWQPIETVPKDRLVHLWIAATPRGERWSAEDHLLPYCYYDAICSEWRSSRPQGCLVCVPERFVTHWRDEDKPAAPTPSGGE